MKTKIVSTVSFEKPSGKSGLGVRITEAAEKLFLKRGFFGVTSDDIAADLGISKATLYRCFQSKEDILMSVIDSLRNSVISRIETILGDKEADFLEKLAGLAMEVGRMFPVLNSEMAEDIKKRLPRIWKDIEDFRRRKLLVNFRILIDEGVRKGVFKHDIDRDLVVEMYITLIERFLDPDVLARENRRAEDVFQAIIDVVFTGILAETSGNEFTMKKRNIFRFGKEGLR